MSGSAEIKDGALWINGVEVRKLSDLKPYQDYTNTNSSASNSFTMPVGQQMFVTMRLCNEAMLCTNKSHGVVVITNSDSVVATSTNGSAIEEKLSITSRKRAAAELDIQTPSGNCVKNISIIKYKKPKSLEDISLCMYMYRFKLIRLSNYLYSVYIYCQV